MLLDLLDTIFTRDCLALLGARYDTVIACRDFNGFIGLFLGVALATLFDSDSI